MRGALIAACNLWGFGGSRSHQKSGRLLERRGPPAASFHICVPFCASCLVLNPGQSLTLSSDQFHLGQNLKMSCYSIQHLLNQN